MKTGKRKTKKKMYKNGNKFFNKTTTQPRQTRFDKIYRFT